MGTNTKTKTKASPSGPPPSPLHWPVVLVHGMGGFDAIRIEFFKRYRIEIEYFKGIAELMRKEGAPEVLTAHLPSTGSIEARARVLDQFI